MATHLLLPNTKGVWPQCRVTRLARITIIKWSTYLSFYEIYTAPLQGNYSKALLVQARAKIKVLRRLQNELDKPCGRERSSDGRLFQAEGLTIEGPMLFKGCESVRYHKITSGFRAERLCYLVQFLIIIIINYFSFIYSGDLYSASSRDYYSEALPAQSRTKKKDFREM